MTIMPSRLTRTRSPGKATARPMRMGTLMPVRFSSCAVGGVVAFVEAVEVGDLAVLLGVADAAVEDEAGVGVGGDAVAQVGADEGAIGDLAIAVGDVDVTDAELVDGPAIVVAPGDAALGLALGGEGPDHVRAAGHVLRGEGAAGEGRVRVEGLPITLELVVIALAAEVVPDVFDGDVQGALEEIVGELGTAVGEAVALPVGGIEHNLILRLLDLREGGVRCEQREGEGGEEDLFHSWISLGAASEIITVTVRAARVWRTT